MVNNGSVGAGEPATATGRGAMPLPHLDEAHGGLPWSRVKAGCPIVEQAPQPLQLRPRRGRIAGHDLVDAPRPSPRVGEDATVPLRDLDGESGPALDPRRQRPP